MPTEVVIREGERHAYRMGGGVSRGRDRVRLRGTPDRALNGASGVARDYVGSAPERRTSSGAACRR